MFPWFSLVAVLLVSGAALCSVTIFMMARTLLRPPRMSDGRAIAILRRLSPGDLDLKFEETFFEIRDEQTGAPLRIAAWWIPAALVAERTVIIIHGYADAKVGGIAWAPLFHSLGWNILAIDLRGHGESGGFYTTAGFWERHDLNQVINRLRTERPRETQTLIIFGVSLGAAVALAAVQSRDDVAAMILEGPYTGFREAVAAHGQLFGAPGGWMQRAALDVAEMIAAADFDAVRPVDLIPTTPCPLMIVHAADDCFMDETAAQRLRTALMQRNNDHDMFWEVPGCGHVLSLAGNPEEFQSRVRRFLEAVELTGAPLGQAG